VRPGPPRWEMWIEVIGVARSDGHAPACSSASRLPCESARMRCCVEGPGRAQRGERRPHGTAADDGDVEHAGYLSRTAASTSFTRFGQSAVRMSRPFAVTSTSSSMRTPMFQNALGTFGAGRM